MWSKHGKFFFLKCRTWNRELILRGLRHNGVVKTRLMCASIHCSSKHPHWWHTWLLLRSLIQVWTCTFETDFNQVCQHVNARKKSQIDFLPILDQTYLRVDLKSVITIRFTSSFFDFVSTEQDNFRTVYLVKINPLVPEILNFKDIIYKNGIKTYLCACFMWTV